MIKTKITAERDPARGGTKIKLSEPKSWEIIFPILFMLSIVSLSSFGLRLAEEKIMAKNTALAEEMVSGKTINSVSEYIRTGYQKNGLVLGIKTTSETKEYQAELTDQAYPSLRMPPGKSLTFWVDFKNTGTQTWKKTGANFIALNVSGPAGRISPFRHPYWKEYFYRPCRLSQEEVKPGETGRFIFALKAPLAGGDYLETFGLVAENKEWISGGEFSIPIEVVRTYQAELVDATASSIKIEPGKALTFEVDFKNRGTTTWRNTGQNFIALNVSDPAGRTSLFKHSFWKKYYRPAVLLNDGVKPGEIARFRFALQAPATEGNYQETFGLVAENLEWIAGGEVSIPITVASAPKYLPPAISTLLSEPLIRIGLYDTASAVTVKANGPYNIKDGAGNSLAAVADGETSVEFVTGQYLVKAPGYSQSISNYIRFTSDNPETVFEITSFNNFTDWNNTVNDNKFRGNIEIRYSTSSRKVWVIDELPLESYLRGLGEASGDQPYEYLKALITAARTYAMYHIQTGGLKHTGDNFILDDSANDQVYRGYNIELRSPQITQATLDTAGQMVTYQDQVVITPYFSRSDGRTRNWTEVFGGSGKPWLVSVPDPYCQGMTLWGHGVGLSGTGARALAQNENKTWLEILKYYYTGVEIKKIY
ncbi:MAG: SpoIID/LytB domain-containing protein [Patescibacteria group bacterium]